MAIAFKPYTQSGNEDTVGVPVEMKYKPKTSIGIKAVMLRFLTQKVFTVYEMVVDSSHTHYIGSLI